MSPDEVRRWQRLLAALGHVDKLGASGIDGRYGPATKASTAALQRELGLPTSGVVDAPTRRLAAIALVELAGQLLGA